MDDDNLYFRIFFPISVYLVYSIAAIVALALFADNPVVFRYTITGLGIELKGIDLLRANIIFKIILILSLFIPLLGVEETKKQLGPVVTYVPIAVKWYQHRFILYLAVLVFVMTTTIMWTIRAITSAELKEYFELSNYSLSIDVVTNTVFLFFLLVAFVTLLVLKWFDSNLNANTGPEEMDNKKSAGR